MALEQSFSVRNMVREDCFRYSVFRVVYRLFLSKDVLYD
jgi:hypothetical protein